MAMLLNLNNENAIAMERHEALFHLYKVKQLFSFYRPNHGGKSE